MKILLTNTGPWGTGSFTTIDSIAQELEKRGHQVKLFFPDNNFIPSPEKNHFYSNPDRYEIWQFPINQAGISIPAFPLMIPGHNSRSPDSLYTLKRFSAKQFYLYLSLLKEKLQTLIGAFKPDIIESQHIWTFGYVLSQLQQKYILGTHNSDQLAFVYDYRMQRYAVQAAKQAELIFATSEKAREIISWLYNISPDKIIVLLNSYNEQVFKKFPVNRKLFLNSLNLQIPDDAKIVCYAGMLTRIKGFDILLKANYLLDPSKNIHFLVFGSGNWRKVIEKDELKKISLDRVHIVGHHPQITLSQAYNIADLLVVPSRQEACPNVALLEAMGCGLPVIAACGYGIEKIVVGGIFKHDTPENLVESILKITSLPKNKIKLLQQAALKKAAEHTCIKNTLFRLRNYELMEAKLK